MPSEYSVPMASDVLSEPDTPTTATVRHSGTSTSISRRLLWRAPRTPMTVGSVSGTRTPPVVIPATSAPLLKSWTAAQGSMDFYTNSSPPRLDPQALPTRPGRPAPRLRSHQPVGDLDGVLSGIRSRPMNPANGRFRWNCPQSNRWWTALNRSESRADCRALSRTDTVAPERQTTTSRVPRRVASRPASDAHDTSASAT